jgi:hypothetical protein
MGVGLMFDNQHQIGRFFKCQSMFKTLLAVLCVLGSLAGGFINGYSYTSIPESNAYSGDKTFPTGEADMPEKLVLPLTIDVVEDGMVLLQIWDQTRTLIFSGLHEIRLGALQVADPSQYLEAGAFYTYDVILVATGRRLVSEIPFVYWPVCNTPTELKWEYVGDSMVMLRWSDPEVENAWTYRLRFGQGVGSPTDEYDYLDVGLVNEVLLHAGVIPNLEQVSLQKICRYENEVELYGIWKEFGKIRLGSGDRSLVCGTFTYDFEVPDSLTTYKSITVVLTDGPLPDSDPDGPWYRVMHRVKGSESWNLLHFTSGSSIEIEPLQPATRYEVKVIAAVGPNKYSAEECEDIPGIKPARTRGEQIIQNVYCGADGSYTTDPNDDPFIGLDTGMLVVIYNFPMRIKDIDSVGPGWYAGSGEIKVPFQSMYVSVEFDSIYVNENGNVKVGNVYGIDDPVKRSELEAYLAQAPAGDFSCEPPSPDPYEYGDDGLNSFGFDSNGKYGRQPPYPGWEEGMPFDENYDPNGFGANGLHRNGTLYNDKGCSQAGLDSLGQPCDPSAGNIPYYWMYDTDNPTQEGEQFWIGNEEKIYDGILDAVVAFQAVNSDSIAVIGERCHAIRTTMRGIVTDKQLDSLFLFGASNEYFSPGLHKHFASQPERYSNNLGRDADIMTLEKQHYFLYHCDRYLNQYLELDSILTSIVDLLSEPVDAPTLQAFQEFIKPYIVSMDSNQLAATFDDPVDSEKVLAFIYPLVVKKILSDYVLEKQEYGYDPGHEDASDIQYASTGRNGGIPYRSGIGCSAGEELFTLGDIPDILAGNTATHLDAVSLDAVQELAHVDLQSMMTSMLSDPEFGLLQPLEMTKYINSNALTIYLDSFEFSPVTGGKLDAYFILTPQSGKRIVFIAKDVSFHKGGLTQEFNLYLTGDNFSILARLCE